jgi:hypothetical protein
VAATNALADIHFANDCYRHILSQASQEQNTLGSRLPELRKTLESIKKDPVSLRQDKHRAKNAPTTRRLQLP